MKLKNNLIKVYFTVSLIITLLGSVACSNENVETHQNENVKNMSQTIQDLVDFNASLATRGEVSADIKAQLSIIVSDAAGAFEGARLGINAAKQISGGSRSAGISAGGAVIGSAASHDKYISESSHIGNVTLTDADTESINDETSNTNESNLSNQLDIVYFEAAYAYSINNIVESDYSLGRTYASMSTECIRVGILHNKILQFLSMIDKGINPASYYNLLTQDEKDILTSEYFIEGRNKIRNSYGFPFHDIKTEADVIMDLLKNAILDSGKDSNAIYLITSQYVQLINQSKELSNDERSALMAGIAVMIYSYDYWKGILKLK